MDPRQPSIAAIALIGRHNNPLHISLFPSSTTTAPNASPDDAAAARDKLEYHFLLNSSLDVFEARMPSKTIGHDFGLLHAIDERRAMYGWLLTTGVKVVIVVDMEGAPAGKASAGGGAVGPSGLGLRGGELTPVCPIFLTIFLTQIDRTGGERACKEVRRPWVEVAKRPK